MNLIQALFIGFLALPFSFGEAQAMLGGADEGDDSKRTIEPPSARRRLHSWSLSRTPPGRASGARSLVDSPRGMRDEAGTVAPAAAFPLVRSARWAEESTPLGRLASRRLHLAGSPRTEFAMPLALDEAPPAGDSPAPSSRRAEAGPAIPATPVKAALPVNCEDPELEIVDQATFGTFTEVGHGDFGSVVRATNGGRTVILKLFTPSRGNSDDFSREVRRQRMAARLGAAPSVTEPLFCLKTSSGEQQYAFGMEYIEGAISLAQYSVTYRSHPNFISRLHEIMDLVNNRLAQLHQNEIFHYDVSPANILVVGDENQIRDVKLIDYGVFQLGSGATQFHVKETFRLSPRSVDQASAFLVYLWSIEVYRYDGITKWTLEQLMAAFYRAPLGVPSREAITRRLLEMQEEAERAQL